MRRGRAGLATGFAVRSPGDGLQLVGMPVADPLGGVAARVVEWPAGGQPVQVAAVRRHPAAELRGIPDMPVARDQPAHAGHRGEPLQAGPVVAERVVLGLIAEPDRSAGRMLRGQGTELRLAGGAYGTSPMAVGMSM